MEDTTILWIGNISLGILMGTYLGRIMDVSISQGLILVSMIVTWGILASAYTMALTLP